MCTHLREQWQNLRDYTSSQKPAQEPEVRGLEIFTTKNKNCPPKGEKKKNSLNNRASKRARKTSPFLLQPHLHTMFPNTDQPLNNHPGNSCSFNTQTSPCWLLPLQGRTKDTSSCFLPALCLLPEYPNMAHSSKWDCQQPYNYLTCVTGRQDATTAMIKKGTKL